ncbi:MAG: class I SAM-dependent methyltransferase [Spirochaetia bacterium]|jgi:demethylmenaquinone methyltransferase/2-methoxy-6-polyprenyl-1,4-benzoquinol methylase
MSPPPLAVREQLREERFRAVWNQQLDAVFADVAPYYDRANNVASLGLWRRFLDVFMSTIDVRPRQRVLDVCAGTNAVGIALLTREPTLEVHAIDRSAEMQEVGRARARALGFSITGTVGDAHSLPYPDNHFDVVTLQYASRHLRVDRVFSEILRVLKPGGRFHHCDMLRPGHPVLEKLYFVYLRMSLAFTGFLFRSGPAALECKRYFISTLAMFYSAEELSSVLASLGYRDVASRTILAGMIGCHSAGKPRV